MSCEKVQLLLIQVFSEINTEEINYFAHAYKFRVFFHMVFLGTATCKKEDVDLCIHREESFVHSLSAFEDEEAKEERLSKYEKLGVRKP
jgi:hypothetical protein